MLEQKRESYNSGGKFSILARNAAYRKTEQGRARMDAGVAAYRAREPEKAKARSLLHDAVALGKLNRLPCFECGEPKTHGHHTDYSRPLSVEWLCAEHHREAHRKIAL